MIKSTGTFWALSKFQKYKRGYKTTPVKCVGHVFHSCRARNTAGISRQSEASWHFINGAVPTSIPPPPLLPVPNKPYGFCGR